MLWNCVPEILRVVRAIHDGLVRVAILNEAGYVIL
jgi:hypothetical protein